MNPPGDERQAEIKMSESGLPATTMPAAITDYFRIALDKDFGLTVHVSTIAVVAIVVLVVVVLVVRLYLLGTRMASFEIDEAEFGLGDHKITLRANELDRTVAYRIWVELSTRKIGLEIDPDHDVIDDIYSSWHEFFSITRELIKDVPISKVRKDSTRKIIHLSIEVLNEGLRPHLTRWQARFRRWYAYKLTEDADATLHPQEIQKQFPAYDELLDDMLAVNRRLINYRSKMYELVTQ